MPHSVKKRANAKLAREEIPEGTFESSTTIRRRTLVCEGTGRQWTGRVRENSKGWGRQLPPPPYLWNGWRKTRGFSSDKTRHPYCFIGNRGKTETLNCIRWFERVSTANRRVEERRKRNCRKTLGVTGEILDIQGQRVSFVLAGRKFSHIFLVCPLPTKADGLLGTNFLEKADAEINFDKGKLSLVDKNEAPYACGIVSKKHAAPYRVVQRQIRDW